MRGSIDSLHPAPRLHLVEAWCRKIGRVLRKHIGIQAVPAVLRAMSRELAGTLRPQQADHTRKDLDSVDMTQALYESLVDILGGMVVTQDAVDEAAVRLSGMRDMLILGKPAQRFYTLKQSVRCHLRVVSIEPKQDLGKYLITLSVLDGPPTGERVTTYTGRVGLERLYRKIGLLGKQECRVFSYKELLGCIILAELRFYDGSLRIGGIEENQSVINRNKRGILRKGKADAIH